jgi:hypothetical protein
MAKSKHATALFEVMARQRAMESRMGSSSVTLVPPSKSGSSSAAGPTTAASSSSPKWWFKSRTAPDVKTIAPGELLTPSAASTATAADTGSDEAAPAPAATAEAPAASSSSRVIQPVAMEVDPATQEIRLRLTYTSALIGGFAVVIALGLCILIGKSLSRGPSPALASTSTAQLKRNPPTAGVMHVQRRQPTQDQVNEMVEVAGAGARPVNSVSTGTQHPPQHSYNEPRPPATFFTDDPHRINGLNYAVIQSYPGKEKEMAEKAAAFLTSNGIPCTVEKDLPGWRMSWKDSCILVGIRGFDKTKNNPNLEAYKKQIMQVSGKFTNGRSGFKSFDPTMYQWKKSN